MHLSAFFCRLKILLQGAINYVTCLLGARSCRSVEWELNGNDVLGPEIDWNQSNSEAQSVSHLRSAEIKRRSFKDCLVFKQDKSATTIF